MIVRKRHLADSGSWPSVAHFRQSFGPMWAAGPRAAPADGSVLPFAPAPSASVAGATSAGLHARCGAMEPNHSARADAPNIVIIMLDDVDSGYRMPTVADPHSDALADCPIPASATISFHTASICSSTRAALVAAAQPPPVGSEPSPSARSTRTATSARLPRDRGDLAQGPGGSGYKPAPSAMARHPGPSRPPNPNRHPLADRRGRGLRLLLRLPSRRRPRSVSPGWVRTRIPIEPLAMTIPTT